MLFSKYLGNVKIVLGSNYQDQGIKAYHRFAPPKYIGAKYFSKEIAFRGLSKHINNCLA